MCNFGLADFGLILLSWLLKQAGCDLAVDVDQRIKFLWLEDGDHDMKPRKKSEGQISNVLANFGRQFAFSVCHRCCEDGPDLTIELKRWK